MKNLIASWKRASTALAVGVVLAFSPAVGHASDHQGLAEWCAENRAHTAVCVLGAAVVLPTVLLHELGERFEAACIGFGGDYLEDVGTAYPYQWGCEGADEAPRPRA